MSPRWVLSLLVLLLILGMGWLGFRYYGVPRNALEIHLDTLPPRETEPASASSLSSKPASASRSVTTMTTKEGISPEQEWEQIKQGREVLHDFSRRFSQYEEVLNGTSFIDLLRQLVNYYIQHRQIKTGFLNLKAISYPLFHTELVAWIIQQDDTAIQNLAKATAFFVVEHFYQLPLTLTASGVVNDLEGLDFNTPLWINGKKTSPARLPNGELQILQEAKLEQYNPAQQFFYRRGPQFSAKINIFFKTYLAYGK